MSPQSPCPAEKSSLPLNQFSLKLLALVSMTIDHTAAVLGSDVIGQHYEALRAVGRLAFPIYCFLLVEGYFHTRDVKKYLLRLLLAALLSELPFDLAIYHRFPALKSNVMLTLFLGLMTVLLLDRSRSALEQEEKETALPLQILLYFGILSLGMGLAQHFQTDYSRGGVLLIALFYLFRGQLWALLTTIPPVLLIFYKPLELWGALALLPIALYNGRPGPRPGGRAGQWFFYLYYPLHLSALALLRGLVFHRPLLLFDAPLF